MPRSILYHLRSVRSRYVSICGVRPAGLHHRTHAIVSHDDFDTGSPRCDSCVRYRNSQLENAEIATARSRAIMGERDE